MFKNENLNNLAFIISVVSGFLIWFVAYLLLPITTNGLNNNTLLYLGSCVLCLLGGFFSFGNKTESKKSKQVALKKYIYVSIILAVIGLFFRYFELFTYRNLSFSNNFQTNKKLSLQLAGIAPLWIKSLSTLRMLSAIPLLLLVVSKNRTIKYWLFSAALVLLSLAEIVIFGSRKPLFFLCILLVVAILVTYKRVTLFNYKSTAIISVLVIILGVFSYTILNKRMQGQNNKTFIEITESRYNDFVKIEANKLKAFRQNPNSSNTKLQLLIIHTGQYIVHGIYELDYIMNQNLSRAKGLYTFNPFFKFTNRLGITNCNLNRNKFHPRGYVYVTFFGALYIDFGWYALIFIFIFGALQKKIAKQSKKDNFFKVLWVYVLAVNIAMPIFNLMSGSQLYLYSYLGLTAIFILIYKGKKKVLIDN